MVNNASAWACRSVGKPGKGCVVISTGRRAPVRRTYAVVRMGSPPGMSRASCSPSSTSTPAARSISTGPTKPSTGQFAMVSSPWVIAAAMAYVPASMRSGMIRRLVPPSWSTPSMTMRGVPRPEIRAPMAIRRRPRSTISGSQAALSMTVRPRASVAALMMLAVPSTVLPKGPPRKTVAPLSPPAGAFATTSPFDRLMVAPRAARPLRCRSIGRGPIAQPPGMEIRACPRRASMGPSTQTPARIVRTRS